MASTVYAYEFDPYGTNANNKITGERHTITAANGTDLNFFIPKLAPFHRRGFVLTNVATGQPMRPGYDYYFGYRFDQMLLSGGMQPIYGAIVFNDRTFGGEVSIDYQTLGGEFTLDTNTILTLLANKQLDPRTVVWSAVVDVPADLPPVAHRHAVDDMTGMSDVVARIYDLIDATGQGFNKSMQALLEHIADHNNPHHITLADLGLDDLGNLVAATKEQAEGGTDNVNYMTSLRVMQSITANAVPLINAHATRTDNPHSVTKAQVGLGSVENYLVATNTEAQAGVATNRYMTPATTKAAIDVLAPLALASHTGDKNNPHQTTAAQVGLGSVQNYALASVAEAVAGLSNAKYMTPYLVAQAIANGSGQGLSAHLSDFNNPHNVTKTQVGLGNVDNYVTATKADVVGMVNDHFVTSAMLREFLNGPVTDLIATGGGAITKDSIGLGLVENYAPANAQDVANQASNKVLTPLSGQDLLDTQVITTPAFTLREDWVTDITGRLPYEAIPASAQPILGEWIGKRYGLTSQPDGTGSVNFLYTDVDANLGSGDTPVPNFTFKGEVTLGNGNTSSVFGFPLFSYQDNSSNTHFYCVAYDGTKLYQVTVDTGGILTIVPGAGSAAVSAAQRQNIGTTPNYTVAYARNGNISFGLGDGTTTFVTLSTTVATVVGLLGIDATNLTYTFGFFNDFDVTDATEIVFNPQSFLNLYMQFNDLVTGKKWVYDEGAWTSTTAPDTFRAGRHFYNAQTEELLFSVSAKKMLSLYSPSRGIVDSSDVTATPVDGGVKLFVRDGTIADA